MYSQAMVSVQCPHMGIMIASHAHVIMGAEKASHGKHGAQRVNHAGWSTCSSCK